jgi:hypothetical protein
MKHYELLLHQTRRKEGGYLDGVGNNFSPCAPCGMLVALEPHMSEAFNDSDSERTPNMRGEGMTDCYEGELSRYPGADK